MDGGFILIVIYKFWDVGAQFLGTPESFRLLQSINILNGKVDLVQHEISVLGFRVCMWAVSAALGPRDDDGVLQKSFLRSFSPTWGGGNYV